MLIAAALSLSLLMQSSAAIGGHGAAHETVRHRHIGPWRLEIRRDRFAGAVTCRITARDITLSRETLIFRIAGPERDTTHAVYRIDGGPPHPVSEVFGAVQAHGFFPERGWILNPQGGEVALPAASVTGARRVALRAGERTAPSVYNVSRLGQALRQYDAAGCAEIPSPL
jgi:hypothetical protein